MKRSCLVAAALLLMLLSLAACGGGSQANVPQSPSDKPQAAGAKEAASQAPAGQESKPAEQPAAAPKAKEAPAQQAAASDEEDLSLGSRDEGLDKLKSYRMRWQAEWSTTESGKSDKGTWDWSEEFSANPPALHWVWKQSDAAGKDKGQMESWQIGDTMYMTTLDDTGKGTCVSFSGSEGPQLTKGIFTPNSLGSLSGAKYVGTATVNGIRSKHYRYDEKAAVLAGFGRLTGEVWVAADGGFVVKDVLSWEGSAGPFSLGAAGEKGKGSWTWQLSDVNQPIAIKAPEDCGGAASGLPMMPDAKDKAVMGDVTNYRTPSKSADVVAFYQREMIKAGWKQSGETAAGPMTNLEFGKDGKTASVTIMSDGAETNVIVNVN